MSQFYQGVTEGALPPTVATSYTTNLGTAVPVSNVLDVKAVQTAYNNDAGIQTRGGATDTEGGAANDLEVQRTNRAQATTTTSGAANATGANLDFDDVATLGMTSDGTFAFYGYACAYNKTDDLGATFKIVGAIRITGGTATDISVETVDVFKEAGMEDAQATADVVLNLFAIVVTGIAGKDINWNTYFEYFYVDGVA